MPKRVLYFHIHGTTGFTGDYGVSFFRYCATTRLFGDPALFTGSVDEKLIPLHDPSVPDAPRNNFPLLSGLAEKDDRFFVNWSGGLSVAARKKAAQLIADRIEQLTKNDDDVEVVLVGHSHGGTIGKMVAEIFAAKKPMPVHPAGEDKKVRFHHVTPAMPLIGDPPEVMPEQNTGTHLHFHSKYDIKNRAGVAFYQGKLSSYCEDTKDVYAEKYRRDGKTGQQQPEYVQTYDVSQYCGYPPNNHEKILHKPAADQIDRISAEIIAPKIGKKVRKEERTAPTPSKPKA